MEEIGIAGVVVAGREGSSSGHNKVLVLVLVLVLRRRNNDVGFAW